MNVRVRLRHQCQTRLLQLAELYLPAMARTPQEHGDEPAQMEL
jgi:hypothetical protein